MELAPGVYSIGQRKGGRVHAYLFEHGGELTLIDTLFDTDARVVLDYLRGIGRLKQLSGATVHAHAWEGDIIAGERLAQPVSMRPRGPLRTYPFRIGLALGRPKHVPCPVDQAVQEDDQVGPLRVLHIPGHTPGHLAFHWAERGVLAVGDAIATWPQLDAGWPGFNLNEEQYRASLRRLAQLEANVVAVGHGEALAEGAAEDVHAAVDRAVA